MDGPGTYSQPPYAGGSKDESGTAAKDTISIGSGDRVSGADRMGMEVHTISNNPYKSAAYMVVADDEEREYGDAAGSEEKKQSYEEQGIGIISMKNDFKTIYGEDEVKQNEKAG
jgi:hypothetical protein